MSSRQSLSRRVFVTILGMSLTTIIVFALALTLIVQQRLVHATSAELADEARVVAASLNSAPSHLTMLRRLHLENIRVTLVDSEGDVLFDSDTDASKMEDHADRPEIEQAVSTGYGSAEHNSPRSIRYTKLRQPTAAKWAWCPSRLSRANSLPRWPMPSGGTW